MLQILNLNIEILNNPECSNFQTPKDQAVDGQYWFRTFDIWINCLEIGASNLGFEVTSVRPPQFLKSLVTAAVITIELITDRILFVVG